MQEILKNIWSVELRLRVKVNMQKNLVLKFLIKFN